MQFSSFLFALVFILLVAFAVVQDIQASPEQAEKRSFKKMAIVCAIGIVVFFVIAYAKI